jgi:hypothetical protein
MQVKHPRPTIAEPSAEIGSPQAQHSPRSAASKLSRSAASSVARDSPGLLESPRLDMSYMDGMQMGDHHMLDNVFVDPASYKVFLATGM